MQLFFEIIKILFNLLRVQKAHLAVSGPCNDRAVFKNTHILDDAVFLAVARHIADAGLERLPRSADMHGLALYFYRAGSPVCCTENRLKQLTSAVAQKAREAEHLAGVHFKADVSEMRLQRHTLAA